MKFTRLSFSKLICTLQKVLYELHTSLFSNTNRFWVFDSSVTQKTTRSQIANIGFRPYTDKVFHMRATSLANKYPQYDKKVIMDFCKAVTFYGDKHGITE